MASARILSFMDRNRSLDHLFDIHAEVINAIPGAAERVQKFKQKVGQTQQLTISNGGTLKGVTDTNNELRETIITKAFPISSKMGAYALNTNNMVLYNEVHLSKKVLGGCTKEATIEKCSFIFDKASSFDGQLIPYNITHEMVEELGGLLTQYKTNLPEHKIKRIEHSQNYKQIELLISDCQKIVDELAILFQIVKESNPEFYNAFQEARRIVSPISHKRAITGKTVDGNTGLTLRGVTISVYLASAVAKTITTSLVKPVKTIKSAIKGGFSIDTLDDGTYFIEVGKPGYEKSSVTVNVSSGEPVKLTLELKPTE